MEFKELAQARFSLRKFDAHPVEQAVLDVILAAGQAAPTAKNYQPQRIFVLQSPEALEKVKSCTPYQFGAPLLLVLAYDPAAAWTRETDGKNHGEIDTAIAATHMMLQAADLGLGTTYVGVYDAKLLEERFPTLAGLRTIGLLPLGYPAQDAHPARIHAERKALSETVSYL